MSLLAAACLAAHVSHANHTQLISLLNGERSLGLASSIQKGLLYVLLVYKTKTYKLKN
jgi:hypothetical protein